MAKKNGRTGRPRSPEGEQRTEVIAFRCRPSYKDWAVGLAEHLRLSPTDALDAGLVELARKHGYEPPPKR